MKFRQVKPQIKNMKMKYFDLYYTVIKNKNEEDIEEEQKEILDNQNENDIISLNDVIIPNQYVGIKGREK